MARLSLSKSLSKLILVTALAALSLFLIVVFFLVYFTDDGTQPIELTTNSKADTPQVPLSGTGETSFSETGQPENTPAKGSTRKLRVYIAGAVGHPGVYSMQVGDRLVDVVEAAKGATAMADLEAVNLAVRVEDEGYYFIPDKEPKPATDARPQVQPASEPTPRVPVLAADPSTGELPAASKDATEESQPGQELVNVNTADQAKLETLPGIGPARAQAIIAYRDQNGPFSAIEEITAVSGIGQGILENLQQLVTVGK